MNPASAMQATVPAASPASNGSMIGHSRATSSSLQRFTIPKSRNVTDPSAWNRKLPG
jgi:hypothetical protein